MRVYLSHWIRGLDGKVDLNRKIATHYANQLRKYFPTVDFYVPAEHDEFPQKAMDLKLLTVDDVLDIDIELLKECDTTLILCPPKGLSCGQKVELRHSRSSTILDVRWSLDDNLTIRDILSLAYEWERYPDIVVDLHPEENQESGPDRWLEYCPACKRKHVMKMGVCPECGTHECAVPASSNVLNSCTHLYRCDACAAYRTHLV